MPSAYYRGVSGTGNKPLYECTINTVFKV